MKKTNRKRKKSKIKGKFTKQVIPAVGGIAFKQHSTKDKKYSDSTHVNNQKHKRQERQIQKINKNGRSNKIQKYKKNSKTWNRSYKNRQRKKKYQSNKKKQHQKINFLNKF